MMARDLELIEKRAGEATVAMREGIAELHVKLQAGTAGSGLDWEAGHTRMTHMHALQMDVHTLVREVRRLQPTENPPAADND